MAVLALGVLSLAGCGGSSGGGGGGSGHGTIFLESFSGAFPGAWQVVQPTAQIFDTDGYPGPCVRFPAGGVSNQPWIQYRPSPASTWNWQGGIQLYVFARFVEGASSGSAEIDVLSLDSMAPGVDGTDAMVDVTGSLATGLHLDYRILTHAGWVSASEDLPAGSGWHDYTYAVRSDGTAAWYRDTIVRLDTGMQTVYPANLGVALRGFFGLECRYDEVEVVRP